MGYLDGANYPILLIKYQSLIGIKNVSEFRMMPAHDTSLDPAQLLSTELIRTAHNIWDTS
jgi:hypothetical protein